MSTTSLQKHLGGLLTDLLAEQKKQTALIEQIATGQMQSGLHEVRTSLLGVFVPTSEQAKAIALVERLVNAGALDLVESCVGDGYRKLMRLKIAKGAAEVQAGTAKKDVAEAEFQERASVVELCPLEQAIDQAVRLVGEATGALAERMSLHLDRLLDMQLDRLEPKEMRG